MHVMSLSIDFLKRLPQALHIFDAKTAKQRLLPPLLLQLSGMSLHVHEELMSTLLISGADFQADDQIAVFALPSVLRVADLVSKESFEKVCFVCVILDAILM